MTLGPNADLGQGVESTALPTQANVSDEDKRGKSPPHLGILQKDGRKGISEKSDKSGHKKDIEKIKLIGENLVDS